MPEFLDFQPRKDQQSSSASKPPTTSPSINPQPTSQQHQQPAQTLAPVPEDAALMTWTRRMNLTVMLNVWVKHKLLKFHIFPKFLLVHMFHVLHLHYQVAGHQRQITVAEPEPQPANMPTPRAPQPAPGTPLQTAMQQPDRLGPYVADDAPWNDYCPGL